MASVVVCSSLSLEFQFLFSKHRMSFWRLGLLKNVIPKRGLEEFLDASKVVGKDTIYGASGSFSLVSRPRLEVFRAASEKL